MRPFLQRAFSFLGSDSRLRFLAYLMAGAGLLLAGAAIPIGMLISGTLVPGAPPTPGQRLLMEPPMTLGTLLAAAILFLAVCRRLRDLEWPLWVVVFLLLPLCNTILTIPASGDAEVPIRLKA